MGGPGGNGINSIIETGSRDIRNGTMKNKKKKLEICSVCKTDFDLDAEGGTKGEFGIIPVAFCPTCLSSTFDMVEKLK